MIHLTIEEGTQGVPSLLKKSTWYGKYYRACNTALGKKAPHITITVILTGDEQIKKLNAEYRKLARTTDVLSFYYGEDGMTGEGEVFISIPVAIRQAQRFEHSLEKEIARLLVHGIF
ncbi:MAG: rRNA maturation RNase YbeY, partial [Patescibacteria group bacterium]